MPEKDKNIFLSSTGKDLQEYRDAVYTAISKMEGVKCVRMEDFGAGPESPRSTCINKLKNCKIFVGIIGEYYGSTPPSDSKSFTEHEYDAAIENDIPMLMFVTGKDFTIKASLRQNDTAWEKQQEFRKRVLDKHVIDKAETPDKLATNVVAALHNLITNPAFLLHMPQDRYVFIIESDSNSADINVLDIDNMSKKILTPFDEARVIKKITIVRTSTKTIYSYDFSMGELPNGIEFSRHTSASYQTSNRIAKIGEPRFIELSSGGYGLLMEPLSTNLVKHSNFSDTQNVLLSKGTYTIWFESESSIELRGLINTVVQPNMCFTFQVTSNEQNALVLDASGTVAHVQLERGSNITSKIKSSGCAVTRSKDEIKINIPSEEPSESSNIAISIR